MITTAKAFFKPNPTAQDNGLLNAALDKAVDRFALTLGVVGTSIGLVQARRANEALDDALTAALEPLGEKLSMAADYDDLVQTMAPTLEAGDIVVFMSNGGFGGARQTLTALLKRLRSE